MAALGTFKLRKMNDVVIEEELLESVVLRIFMAESLN